MYCALRARPTAWEKLRLSFKNKHHLSLPAKARPFWAANASASITAGSGAQHASRAPIINR
eukprot:4962684-Heterocapsa_arctica.AAC.1